MNKVDFKEACRLFWMVKGHLNTEDHVIVECYDGYFKRMWYNEEGYTHEEGFEEAWEKKYGGKQNKTFERRGLDLPNRSSTHRNTKESERIFTY